MTTDTLTRKLDFPGLVTADGKPWHYLDSGATAQKPQAVIDATVRALGADYATVHRGVYARSAEMTLAFEQARRTVAGSNPQAGHARSMTHVQSLTSGSIATDSIYVLRSPRAHGGRWRRRKCAVIRLKDS